MHEIKEEFEAEVRDVLISPSSAIFTYKSQQYSADTKLFRYVDYVESQNTYSAMIRSDFILTLHPSTDEDGNACISYTWKFVEE